MMLSWMSGKTSHARLDSGGVCNRVTWALEGLAQSKSKAAKAELERFGEVGDPLGLWLEGLSRVDRGYV